MVRLIPETTAVLVVDVQEKLAHAMEPSHMEALERAATVLLEAADALGVFVLATEQYPKGLGPTVAPIRERLEQIGAPILSKMDFSACDAPGFSNIWRDRAPRAVVVIGMETHVCVYQTVRELRARGTQVHLPIDGVASRRSDHRDAGIGLCRELGASITTTETIVFDWLRRAGSDEFKRLSKVIR